MYPPQSGEAVHLGSYEHQARNEFYGGEKARPAVDWG
jgi:hypothetical protein